MSGTRLILQEAIRDGLTPLGPPIVKTILWHLKANGVFLNSQEINIYVFYQHLEGIVGNIADVVINEIYMNLQKKFPSSLAGYDPDMPVIDRIDQLIRNQFGDIHTC